MLKQKLLCDVLKTSVHIVYVHTCGSHLLLKGAPLHTVTTLTTKYRTYLPTFFSMCVVFDPTSPGIAQAEVMQSVCVAVSALTPVSSRFFFIAC